MEAAAGAAVTCASLGPGAECTPATLAALFAARMEALLEAITPRLEAALAAKMTTKSCVCLRRSGTKRRKTGEDTGAEAYETPKGTYEEEEQNEEFEEEYEDEDTPLMEI